MAERDRGLCIEAGIRLGREAGRRNVTVWYPENVRGLVRQDDLVVPHSELAMHSGAAGAKIQAWACQGNSCLVAYAKNGACGFVQGLSSEVMTAGLRNSLERHGLQGARRANRKSRRKVRS